MCGGLSVMTVMIQYWCNSLLTYCVGKKDKYTVSSEIFPSDYAATSTRCCLDVCVKQLATAICSKMKISLKTETFIFIVYDYFSSFEFFILNNESEN